jgi:hypothetical protein
MECIYLVQDRDQLGNSWVAEQLVASQEGLSSMELVSWLVSAIILCIAYFISEST